MVPSAQALLNAALSYDHGLGFGIIPVGGRTNVTSATKCPSQDSMWGGKDVNAWPMLGVVKLTR